MKYASYVLFVSGDSFFSVETGFWGITTYTHALALLLYILVWGIYNVVYMYTCRASNGWLG